MHVAIPVMTIFLPLQRNYIRWHVPMSACVGAMDPLAQNSMGFLFISSTHGAMKLTGFCEWSYTSAFFAWLPVFIMPGTWFRIWKNSWTLFFPPGLCTMVTYTGKVTVVFLLFSCCIVHDEAFGTVLYNIIKSFDHQFHWLVRLPSND